MTNEQDPIKIEIPVDEEASYKAETGNVDVANEFRNLGKQFANTLESAWKSEERQRIEGEIREGMQNFADELSKLFSDVKESKTGQRVMEEAETVKTKVGEAEIGRKAQSSVAKGLGWLSEELSRLADRFTPVEKSPEDDEF